MLGSKFGEILSFLKQQIGFSSNFVSLFSIVRQNSSVLFSLKFFYFQQKEPIKVQIWWNFTWAVRSLKFCTLMGSFCENQTKFQLKKFKYFLLWMKRLNKSPNFETFLCTGENVTNSSCHFPNHNSAFLQVLHDSLLPWKTTPLYFFSLNIIYFGQKHPINV